MSMNISVPSEYKSPCVIVHKQDRQNAWSCWQYTIKHTVWQYTGNLLVLPSVIYDNSVDDSYCIEMRRDALLVSIYPFQIYKFARYCMWDID